MGMKARVLGIVAGIALIAAVAVSAAGGAVQADPGITATSVTIGGTHPITGPASLYKTISAAESAYFAYVNDQGGVNGRKINYIVKDDSYDPSKTVPLTQQLVESDKVFAIYGSLGTAPGLATWDYLNSKRVPQVFLATGDSYWGFCHYSKCSGKKYPYTFGWQPSYPGEAKQYGKYIAANYPNAKIGVLYQNDAFGKNYYAGLRVGLGAKKSNIVDPESYDVATQSNLTQQILSMRSKSADILVIFATPSPTITALVTASKVGWTRQATFLGNVSSNRIFMLAAGANGGRPDERVRDDVRQEPDGRQGRPGNGARGEHHRQVRPGAAGELRPRRHEHHVRAGEGVELRLRTQEGRQEPHAHRSRALAEHDEHEGRPVPACGLRDQDRAQGRVPARAAPHGQVGRRRDRGLGSVRQAPQRNPLARRTLL